MYNQCYWIAANVSFLLMITSNKINNASLTVKSDYIILS